MTEDWKILKQGRRGIYLTDDELGALLEFKGTPPGIDGPDEDAVDKARYWRLGIKKLNIEMEHRKRLEEARKRREEQRSILDGSKRS